MTILDYVVLVGYFMLSIGIGLYFVKTAGEMKSITHFFLGGRTMPWWLLGTSMVATTFAADTPILASSTVAQFGLYFNWMFMPFLLTATLTTFFFARLWRRSEVMTDVEFLELRYPGPSGRFLRGFKAVYLGLLVNTLVIGTQLIAIGEIGERVMGIDKGTAMWAGAAISLLYSVMAGFTGVVITDFFQFLVAMLGSVLLAIFVVKSPEVGGLHGLVDQLSNGVVQVTSAGTINLPVLQMVPSIDTPYLTLGLLLIPMMISWWSVVYGGTEPGGGGQVVQRILAARTEAHAAGASLWFNIAHFSLRTWPWLLVGLAGLVVYPELLTNPNTADMQGIYGRAIRDFLPSGLRGLMVASFFAAFISTMETRLNLGAAYLVNDFYRRFLVRDKEERHYVTISRLATVAAAFIPFIVPFFFKKSILNVILFWMDVTAGTGLVFILRWYWWRINAWSEISAMVSAIIYTLGLLCFKYGWNIEAANRIDESLKDILLITVLTTLTWLVVTFLTQPENRDGLRAFFRKTRPAGPGWRSIAMELSEGPAILPPDSLKVSFVAWVSASALLFAVFFGTGKLLLLDFYWGSILVALGAVSLLILLTVIKRVFR